MARLFFNFYRTPRRPLEHVCSFPLCHPFLGTDGQYQSASPDLILASHPVPAAGLAHKYLDAKGRQTKVTDGQTPGAWRGVVVEGLGAAGITDFLKKLPVHI